MRRTVVLAAGCRVLWATCYCRVQPAPGRRLSLPPRTYRLTGPSPLAYTDGAEMLCIAARAVRLHASQAAADVEVICSVA
jgi:hypothetical protein